jgi:catechol 2,3-dioxygenase-like lactoylglutathione lyase family enzyme
MLTSPLVKIYKYQIKAGTEKAYLQVLEEAQALYQTMTEVEFTYLKDAKNPLRRTEVIEFYSADAEQAIQIIDSDPRVLALFKKFENEVLDNSVPIQEEVLAGEDLTASGKVHHIEIYCRDLKKSSPFWEWLLGRLGYKVYQKWSHGISFKRGASYFCFVQAEDKHLDQPYHRCKPGLNHLAFHAPSRQFVDELTRELKARGTTILYPDKHPHASGIESYGVFFEDPERMKVEIMATPSQF